MYTRILVPVDGSATSMLGLNEAAKIASESGAQLRVLNVVDEMIMVPAVDAYPMAGVEDMLESLRESGREALEEAGKAAEKLGISAETVQIESRGSPVSDVILNDARRWRADVIVMGTHGRRGMNRLLLGSDAERVLRQTPVPVLLVRGEERKGSSGKRKTKAPARRRSRARQRG